MPTSTDCIQLFLRPDIQNLHAYSVQPCSGMVKLDVMENPYALPPELQQELGQRLGQVALHRYPAERTQMLKQALAQHALSGTSSLGIYSHQLTLLGKH